MTSAPAAPHLGLGLGLRSVHFDHILQQWPQVDWFEAISENFMDSGGRSIDVLRRVAERYPVVLHGVSLSIGSTDPLDFSYLSRLKALAATVNARWVSDHLCWTGVGGMNSHDLLPLPLNEATLQHVIGRVRQVQDFLEQPLVLENPSSYITFRQSTLSEPAFFRELCRETGCRLLLDVNNVYVSCFNADADPVAYLHDYPCEHVVQMHLAGHQHCGTHIIDTHDSAVQRYVWELFRLAWQRTGGVATLLEWDGNIPSFPACHAEILRARRYMHGEFDAGMLVSTCERDDESLSTPIDFMLPHVMQNTVAEEA